MKCTKCDGSGVLGRFCDGNEGEYCDVCGGEGVIDDSHAGLLAEVATLRGADSAFEGATRQVERLTAENAQLRRERDEVIKHLKVVEWSIMDEYYDTALRQLRECEGMCGV